MSYPRRHGTRRVPQWAPVPASGQVPKRSTDPEMLEVIGFEMAMPQLIAQFARGVL